MKRHLDSMNLKTRTRVDVRGLSVKIGVIFEIENLQNIKDTYSPCETEGRRFFVTLSSLADVKVNKRKNM